jgi:hypothetical protein
VFRRGDSFDELSAPDGCRLERLMIGGDLEVAEAAMRSVGEDPGQVVQRLAQGDQFFGWMERGRIASFGWVTFQNRLIGPAALRDADGRAFLYNFHTVESHRGRGLYPSLLLHLCQVLVGEGHQELIIEVNRRNTASVRGITKAGFQQVGGVAYLTLFRRWQHVISTFVIEGSIDRLFENL